MSPRLCAAGLVLLGLWHAGLRWRSMSLPLMSDEGEYAYEASVLERGGVPYKDAYDQKPPVVFFVYRLAGAVFGGHPWAPRAAAMVFCWVTMAALFLLVPRDWGPWARLSAPAAYGVLSVQPVGDMGFAANTEVFLAAFAALAALALKRAWDSDRPLPWLFASGAAAGAAVMTKQTGLFTLLAFGLLSAHSSSVRPRRARRISAYLAGCAAVPALFLAYFGVRGAAGAMYEQILVRNLDYSSVIARSSAVTQQLTWLAKAVVPELLATGWPAYALAAYGLAATPLSRRSPEGLLTVLWLASALLGCFMGLFFFPHYFLQAYPALAFACAFGAKRLSQRKTAWLGPAVFGIICLYPAAARSGVYFRHPLETVAKELMFPNPLYESQALGDYIQKHSSPEDPVYVFGSEPQIYVYARRRAATPHIFVYPLTLFPRGMRDVWTEMRDLETASPKFIVYVAQPASTLIASKEGEVFRSAVIALLGRKYRWAGTVDIRPGGSLSVFWEDGASGPGMSAMPDWSPGDRIYLFERRS